MKVKNILGFSVGPIGAALLGFISLPVLAWYFSPEDIGRISMLQIVISFTVVLCSLGLDQAYVRDFHETKDKSELLKTAVLPGLLVLLLICLSIFTYSSELISKLLFAIPSSFFSLIVIVSLLSAFLSRFLSLILRMQEKGFAFSMSQLLPKLLFLIIICLYVVSKKSLSFDKLLIAQFVSILVVFLIYSWNTRFEWIPAIIKKIEFKKLCEMIHFGLPLVFGGIASWALTAMDRIFLRSLSSFEELGIYSIAISIAAAVGILSGIFNTIWAPIVFKWSAKNENLDKVPIIGKYVLIIIYFILCLIGMFSWLIPYALPQAYESVQFLVVACVVSPLFYLLSEIVGIGITLTRRTKFSLFAALIAASFNAIGNYLLVPSYGATGAVASTAFSFWIFLICRAEFSSAVWRKFPRVHLYSTTLLCLVFALWYAFFGEYLGRLAIILWIILFLIGLYFFRSSIRIIWKELSYWYLKSKYNF